MRSKPRSDPDSLALLTRADDVAKAKRAADRAAAKVEARDGPRLARAPKDVRDAARADRVIVTSALNNAPLHGPFWASLTRYATHLGAALVVVPARYRNPTTPGEYSTRGPGWWWPAEVVPHLFENEIRFHRRLHVRADLRIGATATHPLQGLEGFGGGASIVVGHAQIAMRTVATPQNSLPKILHTTGSVSRPVYSESAAGAKGRFHHQLGAVIVERDGDAFHLRQLIADASGAFYDLDQLVTPDAIEGGQRAEALVCGDIHVGFTDPAVQRATFDGPDSLCGVTRPKRIFLHDVIDSFSISHHHEHDPIAGVAKHRAGRDSLSAEVAAVAEFLERVIPDGPEVVLVASNHHDHIGKWVLRSDWRRDPRNAETYLETALAMVRAAKVTGRGIETIDPFRWLLSQRLRRKVRFLSRGESCRVARIELSLHGDQGPSGARGSIRNLSRLGVRVVIGHGHAPGIEHGGTQVGTSGPTSPSYSHGSPSRSLHTHAIVHGNGKVQLVNFIRGRFRRAA